MSIKYRLSSLKDGVKKSTQSVIPDYSLADTIAWLTTNYTPLDTNSIAQLNEIINNNAEFSNYIMLLAGITPDNSVTYVQVLNQVLNNDDFWNIAIEITIPTTLFMYLSYMTWNNINADANVISTLFTVLNAIPQFAPLLAQFDGITPENSQNYTGAMINAFQVPMFMILAAQYEVT